MDILFNDGNKRSVPFDAEFAARAIRRSMKGEKVGYQIRLNPELDPETQLKQKGEIEYYINAYKARDLKAGKP